MFVFEIALQAKGNFHPPTMSTFPILPQKIGLFQCLEAEVVVLEVPFFLDGLIQNVLVLLIIKKACSWSSRGSLLSNAIFALSNTVR